MELFAANLSQSVVHCGLLIVKGFVVNCVFRTCLASQVPWKGGRHASFTQKKISLQQSVDFMWRKSSLLVLKKK